MLRLLFWLSGAVALGYVAYRFAAWRVFFQVSLVWVLFLWVIIGGWLVSRPSNARGHGTKPSNAQLEMLRAVSYRQEYASRYGEGAAALIEKDNPQVWRERVRAGVRLP